MRVRLKKLGKLESAEADLGKDLIVFTGRNNTYKTYVAHAVYAACSHRGFGLGFISVKPQVELGNASVDIVGFWLDQHTEILRGLGNRLQRALPSVFAAEKTAFADAKADIVMSDAEVAEAERSLLRIRATETYTAAGGRFVARKVSGRRTCVGTLSYSGREEAPSFPLRSALEDFAGNLISSVILPASCRILPAERSAIQLFSKELLMRRGEVVEKALAGELQRQRELQLHVRRYPLAIRDALMVANDLPVRAKAHSSLEDLADRLESSIMGGGMQVDSDGNTAFLPNGGKKPLAIHLASSSVKSLSSLAFYLRHEAAPGDFLIIDEPELNLHPDNQRHVARILVDMAANRGVKVLVSTHSDYIVREINNMIMLHSIPDASAGAAWGYLPTDRIAPERVGAYLFAENRAIPLDVPDTGIEVKPIDDAINSLNHAAQGIYLARLSAESSSPVEKTPRRRPAVIRKTRKPRPK